LNQSLATEFEFTFRQNHVDRIATSSQALTEGGDLHSYDMMLNQYYRFKNPSPFTPYIGGGIGESSVALNNTRPVGGLDTGPFSGTDAVLAYQGIAGVAYPIAPHLSLAAEYRYFATLRPGFEQNVANRDVKISPSYAVNNVLLRMVYAFQLRRAASCCRPILDLSKGLLSSTTGHDNRTTIFLASAHCCPKRPICLHQTSGSNANRASLRVP
jgi:hypothetical protein